MKATVRPATDRVERRRDSRHDRLRALRMLWRVSGRTSTRGCRRVGTLVQGGATVKLSGGGVDARAGFGGLATCGSVWACPCCAERILAARQDEMTRAFDAWTATGGVVGMVTLTMRHSKGQRLSSLWEGLGRAWNAVTSGRRWESLQTEFGAPTERVYTRGARRGVVTVENRIGWAKVVEVTHGRNGWHVHIHAALLLPAGTTADQLDNIGRLMFQTWRDSLQRNGFAAPLANSGGLDSVLWTGSEGLSDYFSKGSYRSAGETAARELSRPDLKLGRDGNRTPFQILADMVEDFRADDLDLWTEWEQASAGRRQLAWSVGTRKRLLGEDDERTDEEIAAADELDGQVLVVITSRGIARMVRDGLHSVVLDAAELGGRAGLVQVLDHYGIEWTEPTGLNTSDSRTWLRHKPATAVA